MSATEVFERRRRLLTADAADAGHAGTLAFIISRGALDSEDHAGTAFADEASAVAPPVCAGASPMDTALPCCRALSSREVDFESLDTSTTGWLPDMLWMQEVRCRL